MDRRRLKFRVNGCQWEESSTFGHLRLDRGGDEHVGVCHDEFDDDSGCDSHCVPVGWTMEIGYLGKMAEVSMNILVFVTSSSYLDIPISKMMLMIMVAMMMYGFGKNIL